jgi:hypothetical protein
MRRELQDSPYFLPAFCSALLVASYGSLISKEADSRWRTAGAQAAAAAAAAGGGVCSRGGSSSSSSRSSQGEQQQASWRQAAIPLACSAHDALPLSHRELLHLVGCSSKALLWASSDSYSYARHTLSVVSHVYPLLVQAVQDQVKQLLAQPAAAAGNLPTALTAVFLVPAWCCTGAVTPCLGTLASWQLGHWLF